MKQPRVDNDGVRRIGRFVRQGELHQPQPKRAVLPTASPNAWYGKLVVTTSTIGAGGTGTLGKGTAKMQVISVDGSGNASYSATSYDDITIYNGGASIASGRLVQVKLIDSIWVADVDYCPAT